MFALVAFLLFLLALIWEAAPFDLTVAGLMFVALQLVFGSWPWGPLPWSGRP